MGPCEIRSRAERKAGPASRIIATVPGESRVGTADPCHGLLPLLLPKIGGFEACTDGLAPVPTIPPVSIPQTRRARARGGVGLTCATAPIQSDHRKAARCGAADSQARFLPSTKEPESGFRR